MFLYFEKLRKEREKGKMFVFFSWVIVDPFQYVGIFSIVSTVKR